MSNRVALLGLGIMGSGMAGRLLSAGFPLTVYNRSRDKAARLADAGASVAATPREAAARADVVISMVADDAASKAIWFGEDGALAGVARGAILIESSTLSVKCVGELAKAAAERGCEFLDAPVTGTKPHAESGQLLFLVGGSEEALASAHPALEVMSRGIIHLGPTGSGALLKLINNFMCGVQLASFAEANALIDAGKLDREKALTVLTNGAPGSPLVKTIASRISAPPSSPNFVLRLMAKDLSYAVAEAKRHGLPLETADAALGIFKRATEAGHGDEDFSAVIGSIAAR
ncbi:MAG TPA: NAD(P)-dependent oxidoreductase [Candidatus Acidoferrales bacterium]|nr:NAD(P)-dependent oxidoreductase [Candidatus Acidoferrales bacterium]